MNAHEIFSGNTFGIGGVPLGNEFSYVTDEEADETLRAAWNAGVRYFDVAPWYGLGLAERRLGHFLHKQNRNEYLLSSKVGKLLTASRDNNAKQYYPFTDSPNNLRYDYTADGVKRSIEDSLQRLGVDALDIVFVHDISPDNALLPGPWEEQFDIALKGAFPALSKMRDEGVIKGWGVGVNSPEPILKLMETTDANVCLLARQYSLIEHERTLKEVFPKAREHGMGFVVGTSLNAGFISGSARYNYGENNYKIPADVIEKRDRLRELADRHGVDLRTAALQFSHAPDVAAALIVGCASPQQALQNFTSMHTKIPDAFWSDLRACGAIDRDAAVPMAEAGQRTS
jgi:D-threo-aldose 1-dehydrogenase